jgi:hypothetical protein
VGAGRLMRSVSAPTVRLLERIRRWERRTAANGMKDDKP